MNRQDRARREKRMTARRAGKVARARDRGHRTGGVANHAVVTQPLDASARAANYGVTFDREGFAVMTPAQRRRMVRKEGRMLAGLQR
jgi:hypothetical protein